MKPIASPSAKTPIASHVSLRITQQDIAALARLPNHPRRSLLDPHPPLRYAIHHVRQVGVVGPTRALELPGCPEPRSRSSVADGANRSPLSPMEAKPSERLCISLSASAASLPCKERSQNQCQSEANELRSPCNQKPEPCRKSQAPLSHTGRMFKRYRWGACRVAIGKYDPHRTLEYLSQIRRLRSCWVE
jgi:hypothetical protein